MIWWASAAFLSYGLPQMGVQMGREALPFYLISILTVILGAVLATAILWLGGRPKRPRDYKGRAFEVMPPAVPAPQSA